MVKGFCLEVWGDYACFTRPEMKVERVSYDVMTPSAARAIFEAILWKPAIRWHITRIEVMNPIQWVSVRRNEVGCIFTSPTKAQLLGANGDPMGFYIEDNRQQRASYFLRDVRYRIHAWFEFIPPESRKTNHSVNQEIWADIEEKAPMSEKMKMKQNTQRCLSAGQKKDNASIGHISVPVNLHATSCLSNSLN
jgi:CRISPR-associated protein Cas5d